MTVCGVCAAGALAEWLADHPVMLSSVLPLVLQALGNPDLSVSSVSTLKKICRECKYDLPPYATNIVAVSQVLSAAAPHTRSPSYLQIKLLQLLLLSTNNVYSLKSLELFLIWSSFLIWETFSCALKSTQPHHSSLSLCFVLQEVLIKQIHKVSAPPLSHSTSFFLSWHRTGI